MPIVRVFLSAACLMIIPACTPKQVYQNFYEGIRVRNQLRTPPPERAEKPDAPVYRQYETERSERMNR